MRSLSFIAAVAMLAVLPAGAQIRGGGRAAPAMSRPGFAGHAPIARPSRFVPTARGGVRFSTFGGFGSFGGPVFFPGRFHHHHHRFFFANEFFFPGFFWPSYYPYYSYPMVSYSNPSNDYSSASSYQLEMTRELDRLSEEVERLRGEQESRAYANAPAVPAKAESRQEAGKPTVLVFQDKHIQEVENYAIVGQTLWVFSEQRAKKVPLSELDIPATTKLNDERGLEFRVPGR